MKLIIVDDDKDILEMLFLLFQGICSDIELFDDAVIARDYICKNHEDISVVITDLRMPGAMGIDLYKKVYDVNKNPCPFVFFTGYSNDKELQKISEADHVYIVSKPNVQGVYDLVMSIVENK